jgi:hypothetical protein
MMNFDFKGKYLLRFLGLTYVLTYGLFACNEGTQENSPLVTARLQAITYLDAHTIAVTDTAYFKGVWREGRLIVIDLQTQQRLGAWFTPFSNPQALFFKDQTLAVLSSGTLQLGAQPHGGWSSLSVFKRDSAETLKQEHELWLNSHPKGSYLIDLVQFDAPNQDRVSWVMSSGIDGLIWRVDFDQEQAHLHGQRYASDEQLSLGAIAIWKSKMILVDFNQDRLHIFDERGRHFPCSPELGQFENVMEGAQTPVVIDNQLWVSFGLSGRLIQVDLSQLLLEDEACTLDPVVYSPPLGQVPNDLAVHNDQVYVLHSAESALWTYDIMTGQRIKQRGLPVQTNPWQMAISPAGDQLVISEWLRGGLTLLDLDEEAKLTQLSPSLFAPPPPPTCVWSNQVNGISDLGVSIEGEGLTLSWPSIIDTAYADTRDLHSVPQLALLFDTPPQTISLALKLTADSEWITYQPTDKAFRLVTQVIREPEAEERSDSWAYSEILNHGELIQHSSSPPMLGTQIAVPQTDEACDIFMPQSNVLHIDIVDILRSSRLEDEAMGSLESGKIKIHSIRIKINDDAQPIRLVAAAFRRWN